ncbi:MAG: AEC family transporter [Leptospirales bacterium]|nr:AEC family transporter [Leptospirales bacterium]
MSVIFISVMKLFLMILVGFIGRKTNVINKQTTKGLSSLLIKITLPALIFTSMQKEFAEELLSQSFIITGLSFGVYGLYFIIAIIIGKLLKGGDRDTGAYQFAILFSNVAFMGFPVLSSVFGDESIFYAAMFNIPFHFFVFTIGVYLMTRGHSDSTKFNFKLFLNPGVISTILGFIFFYFSIKLSPIIYDPLKLIGDITTPLSMLTVGAMLTEVNHRELVAGWRVYFISFMRLIILPIIVFFFVRLFTNEPMMIYVPVVIAAMPVAVNAPLVAQEYNGNALLASRLMFISTFLSLFTLPIVLLVLKTVV